MVSGSRRFENNGTPSPSTFARMASGMVKPGCLNVLLAVSMISTAFFPRARASLASASAASSVVVAFHSSPSAITR